MDVGRRSRQVLAGRTEVCPGFSTATAGSPAAAPELDGLTARRLPGADAALEHRVRVEAGGGEDARGDRRPGAALAQSDDRLVAIERVERAGPEQPIGNVACPGNVAGIALVLLADVDQLRLAVGEEPVEFVDG